MSARIDHGLQRYLAVAADPILDKLDKIDGNTNDLPAKLAVITTAVSTDLPRKLDGITTAVGGVAGNVKDLSDKLSTITINSNSIPSIVANVKDLPNTLSTITTTTNSIPSIVTNVKDLPDTLSTIKTNVNNLPNTLSTITTNTSSISSIVTNVKDLPDKLTTVNTTIDGLKGKIETLQTTVDKIGAEIVPNIAWINLGSPESTLNKYCSVSSPQMTRLESASARATDNGIMALPTGQSIVLVANIPSPGTQFWGTDAVAKTLPIGTVIALQWSFSVVDGDAENKTPTVTYGTKASTLPATAVGTVEPAVPALSPFDTKGHYQILNGDVSSAVIEVVPFPLPKLQNLSRIFAATLSISVSLPNGVGKGLVPLDPIKLAVRVSDWSAAFGEQSGGSFPIPAPNDTTIDPYNFRNLYSASFDTQSPGLGKPAILRILPMDNSATAQQKLQSVVDATPATHIQAALDIGAPLTNVLNSVVNKVTSLFAHSSGSNTVLPRGIHDAALTVSSVLDGSLSIPIALDFKGQSLAKTWVPQDQDVLHPNVSAVLGSAGQLAGQVPIGKLVTMVAGSPDDKSGAPADISQIRGGADSIKLTYPDDSGITTSPLDNACGLVLQVLPRPCHLADQSVASVNINVQFQPELILPGWKGDPPKLIIDLGILPLRLPSVPIPQLAFFFHDGGFTSQTANDVLVYMDERTSRYIRSNDDVLTAVNELSNVLDAAVQTFPQPPASAAALLGRYNGIQNLLKTASLVRWKVKPTQITLFPAPTYGPQPPLPSSWYKAGDLTNISSIIYIGTTIGAPDQMFLKWDYKPNPEMDFVFSGTADPAWAYSGYIAGIDPATGPVISPNFGAVFGTGIIRMVDQPAEMNSFNDTVRSVRYGPPPTCVLM